MTPLLECTWNCVPRTRYRQFLSMHPLPETLFFALVRFCSLYIYIHKCEIDSPASVREKSSKDQKGLSVTCDACTSTVYRVVTKFALSCVSWASWKLHIFHKARTACKNWIRASLRRSVHSRGVAANRRFNSRLVQLASKYTDLSLGIV